MLSRKQLWRKIKSRNQNKIDFCRPLPDSFDVDIEVTTSFETQLSTNSLKSSNHGLNKRKSALSSSDLTKSLRPLDDRILRFSSKVQVCLIPTRNDLNELGLENIFWKAEDYTVFKKDAVDELRAYLTARGINAKEAIKQLYQPSSEDIEADRKIFEQLMSQPNKKESTDMQHGLDSSSTDIDFQSTVSTVTENTNFSGFNPDEDEPQLFYVNGYKTDVELNKQKSAAGNNSLFRTPSGNQKNVSQVWAVQWQKSNS